MAEDRDGIVADALDRAVTAASRGDCSAPLHHYDHAWHAIPTQPDGPERPQMRIRGAGPADARIPPPGQALLDGTAPDLECVRTGSTVEVSFPVPPVMISAIVSRLSSEVKFHESICPDMIQAYDPEFDRGVRAVHSAGRHAKGADVETAKNWAGRRRCAEAPESWNGSKRPADLVPWMLPVRDRDGVTQR
jgi:hypothetical protein